MDFSTQYSYFFFQVLRRNTAQQVCPKDAPATAVGEVLAGWSSLELMGQRPWRAGKHLLEPPEAQAEAECVRAVQDRESKQVGGKESL